MSTNILGLNNLARDLQASTAKNATQEKGQSKSAFGEILGQTKDQPKPVAKDVAKSQDKVQAEPKSAKNTESRAKGNDSSASDARAERDASSARGPRVEDKTKNNAGPKSEPKALREKADELEASEANALPGQPTGPLVGGPLFNERSVANPIEIPMIGAGDQATAAMFGSDQGVDGLTRRAVWNDFLRKMKDELGVNAEDVLEAMSTLSIEELSQPPQQSIDKVVAALGLDPQASQMAKQFFNELIAKTQPKSLGEELRASGKQIDLSVMSQREAARKQQAGQRVENLNSKFFMNAPELNVAGKAEVADKASINSMLAQMQPVDGRAPGQDQAIDQLVKNFMSTSTRDAKAVPVDEMLGQIDLGATQKASTGSAALGLALPSLGNLAENAAGGELSHEDDEMASETAFFGPGVSGEAAVKGSGNAGEFRTQMSNAAGAANGQRLGVDELVGQAEVMVRDGGGEMKVKLNPEGLGEVAMKVNVDQGKVTVQMITESDEAKQLIERQLGDLKSQLNSNNLQLETIKVDTASNLGKQLEQQYQDAQRQAAHQSLEQFRQDHQGWRRSFFEVPGVRQYRGQNEAPRDAQPPLVSTRGVNSRRLNLVA